MGSDAILVMDPGGKILWANRLAHENVSLSPGALIGRNYLEFCPPDSHADLLRVHRRKLQGETLAMRMDLGGGRIFTITSGPVHVEERLYLYTVARKAVGKPRGDEILIGLLAAGELLRERRIAMDLNSCLLGALKDEARALRGRLSLTLGDTPNVLVRPWPIRMMLRRLLLQTQTMDGRSAVRTGGDDDRAWLTITMPAVIEGPAAELARCRRIAREQGGSLTRRGKVLRLIFPAA